MTNPNLLPAPSLLRCLVTMFYDFFLVIAVWFAAIVALMVFKYMVVGAPEASERMLGGAWRVPTFIVMVLSGMHFFVYFWVKNQQTLAMQTWRIIIVNQEDGQKISWKQAYVRFLAACLSFACLGLGYWWMLFDKNGMSWHDHLSGTRLVLLAKRQ